MNDLVTWLRAQIDEDERMARSCRHQVWTRDGGMIIADHATEEIVVDWVYCEGAWDHIPRWDPARVLGEVRAKRWLLDEIIGELADDSESVMDRLRLQHLALPYADREGYDPSWRPEE
jgi:hypothetical protein